MNRVEIAKLLDELEEAQQATLLKEQELKQAIVLRDKALAKARSKGVGASELSRITGLSRVRVYKILEKAENTF